jgi:hypothetical protein
MAGHTVNVDSLAGSSLRSMVSTPSRNPQPTVPKAAPEGFADQFTSQQIDPAGTADPRQLGETQYADSCGQVKNLALMMSSYAGGRSRTQMLDAYKTLFTRMEPDTKFTITVQSPSDQRDVEKAMKDCGMSDPERVQFIKPDAGSLTVWARDMMVPLYLKDDPNHVALLGQQPLHDWHANDKLVPAAICKANPHILFDDDKSLVTDGGDVMANTKESFVGYYSLDETAQKISRELDADPALKQKTVADYEQKLGHAIQTPADHKAMCEEMAVERFSKKFGKPVTVLGKDDPTTVHKEEPATDHMDMGCTPIDDQTFLVGDPSLAKKIVAGMSQKEIAEAEARLSEAAGEPVRLVSRNGDCQEDFDGYEKTLKGKGYNVIRVPHLENGSVSRSYLSYNNCLMERFERADGTKVRRVFLPVYDIPKLDSYAIKTWEGQGYEVIPMPLGALSERKGALRCVSNWLERGPQIS